MIILEGPDGSGKTTLGKRLKEDKIVDAFIESPGRTRGPVPLMEQTRRYMERYKKSPVVVDRFLFSELVYGPILREKSQFSIKDQLEVMQQIMMNHIPIIFCLPRSYEVLKPTLEENPKVIENLPKIFDSYKNYMEQAMQMYNLTFRYDLNDRNGYDVLVAMLPKEIHIGQRHRL
jgi:thymidylate kinase